MNSILVFNSRQCLKLHQSLSRQKFNISTSAFYYSSKEQETIRIGNVSKTVRLPKNPELVPRDYLPKDIPSHTLKDLKWIMQKDVLGQDVFLLGRPGPSRRLLAKQYLQLTKQEMEYVALSRDTTESDLKQRREIVSGTAHYMDQAAVKAAMEGRVLVLEGIEKVERNVLPVLNNLLENREMHLEDGRLLIPATRYDKLLAEHGQEVMDKWRLVRVSQDFRVIALGLPVPKYTGSPLDPPLRSRFQARDVQHLPYGQQLDLLISQAPNVDKESLSRMLSLSHTLLTEESSALGLADFPIENLVRGISILNALPELEPADFLNRFYPYKLFLPQEGQKSVEDTFMNFQLVPSSQAKSPIMEIDSIARSTENPNHVDVGIKYGANVRTLTVKGGDNFGESGTKFVRTGYHNNLLADLVLSHSVADLCLVGPRGCGKSAVVNELADMLGYRTETIQLYQDMTARDLLQQRTTTPTGDTVWRLSPLVEAAMHGKMAVLDGLHRVHKGSLAVIQRLVTDRELQLYDGTRLISDQRFQALMAEQNITAKELEGRGIWRIHPSFRMVALADPPLTGSAKGQWLIPEILSMFLYHDMRSLSKIEERQILADITANSTDSLDEVLRITHKLRSTDDTALKSISTSLSTRQLIRIARRLQQFPDESTYAAINKACLSRFLPALAKESLTKLLEKCGIEKDLIEEDQSIKCTVENNMLTIGHTSAPLHNPDVQGKIPETLFYDTPQNLAVMEAMLQDFLMGEHLLLIGNQGVGKNKLIDRMLNLLNRPREYIQLNRDTTVQTLTLQPSVRDGVIVYDDSPLVQAVKSGNILVIDEADKAPTNVTCILKSLIESNHMILSDGRRIVPPYSTEIGDNVIKMHPDFRMMVLANRPGFPFLGNDFFGSLGDLFSCHAIDNPSMDSELAMLKQYGPQVPEDVMRRLVRTFSELRTMADEGQIQYPYSTREVVNIVKHLQQFPDDGLGNVVRNVFDFDSYSKEVRETLTEVLHKHGIPIGTDPRKVNLAKEISLPGHEVSGTWEVARAPANKAKRFFRMPVDKTSISMGNTQEVNVSSGLLDKIEARGVGFSELQSYFSLPFHDMAIVGDVAVFRDKHKRQLYDTINVLTVNPVYLFSLKTCEDKFTSMTLNQYFDTRRHNLVARPRMTPLGGKFNNILAIHDEVTGALVLVEPTSGTILPVKLGAGIIDRAKDLKNRLTGRTEADQEHLRMSTDFASDNKLLFHSPGGKSIKLLDLEKGDAYSMDLPFNIKSVHPLSEHQYLVEVEPEVQSASQDSAPIPSAISNMYILKKELDTDPLPNIINPINQTTDIGSITALEKKGLSNFGLSMALGEKMSVSNTMFTTPDSYANVAMGFPELEFSANEVISWERPPAKVTEGSKTRQQLYGNNKKFVDKGRDFVFLNESCQIVRPIPPSEVPKDGLADHVVMGNTVAFLEVIDLLAGKVRYVPVPESSQSSQYSTWYKTTYPDKTLSLCETSNEGLVTVDNSGTVRLWETGVANLERSLSDWKRMVGGEEDLQLTIDRESGQENESPKHGKIDQNNDPHVGGNTWAGGTGGRDTAGLGGKGGPYRLDAGHNVHQLSDAEKSAVPEHIQKAARDMNRSAFKERLREIKMSEYDAQLYAQYKAGVSKQIQVLRTILQNLQAKSQDRTWLKNQTSGELDDNRLIDGLTGERSIYKKRGDQDPEIGTPQEKPKRLKLVVDVSGSMYRFNGHDQRLERMMESSLMVMEALNGFSDRFKYDIVGHSGDDNNVLFVNPSKPPDNEKHILKVLKEMAAHSQFCMSGDHTLSATVLAINELGLTTDQHDESIVIVLSDANFDRYGIRPEYFGKILNRNDNVDAYAIFIGSLGNQADELIRRLPSGKSFVCLDTKKLPEILQTIFTSSLLK